MRSWAKLVLRSDSITASEFDEVNGYEALREGAEGTLDSSGRVR
jgi:hypothetical protein